MDGLMSWGSGVKRGRGVETWGFLTLNVLLYIAFIVVLFFSWRC